MRTGLVVLLAGVFLSSAVASSCAAPAAGQRRATTARRPGIVIGRRIGAVKVGESKAQIVKALGRGTPAQVEGNPARFYGKLGIYVLYPPKRSLPRRVFIVETRSARYKTSSRIGVGSSLRQLQRAVQVTCFGASPHSTLCRHADPAAPTGFLLSKSTKRIVAISIASTAPYE